MVASRAIVGTVPVTPVLIALTLLVSILSGSVGAPDVDPFCARGCGSPLAILAMSVIAALNIG